MLVFTVVPCSRCKDLWHFKPISVLWDWYIGTLFTFKYIFYIFLSPFCDSFISLFHAHTVIFSSNKFLIPCSKCAWNNAQSDQARRAVTLWDLYSGVTGFEFRSGYQLSWRFAGASLSRRMPLNGHDRILPYPYLHTFIIVLCYCMLCKVCSWKVINTLNIY